MESITQFKNRMNVRLPKELPDVFVDAQMMHRLHPDTFEVPEERRLNALKKGDGVKVCYKDERFWVKLTKVAGQMLEGTVDNDLVAVPPDELKYGDLIRFRKDNVYNTILT